ncbi:hypothetical protein [Kitasatospora cheerisanensis]|uniref:hypothetical protein n=1 Tax=Kitasatospora cheerisanensis TaxID=81942 RepID=UPI0012ED844B|nr:hypothetical protein [Kitasatospora cheerisanensis]
MSVPVRRPRRGVVRGPAGAPGVARPPFISGGGTAYWRCGYVRSTGTPAAGGSVMEEAGVPVRHLFLRVPDEVLAARIDGGCLTPDDPGDFLDGELTPAQLADPAL